MTGYLRNWLNVLLVFLPAAVVFQLMGANPALTFGAACLAIIPLAGLMGRATEDLAERAGTGVGGLLNATFGNAAELIIAIMAIRRGLVPLVKASLVGSIVGNLIFVLGMAMLAGGLRRRKQVFNRTAAGAGVTMLSVAVIGMLVPAVYHRLVGPGLPENQLPRIETISLLIAGVLIANYACGLLFSLKTHAHYYRGKAPDAANYVAAGAGDPVARERHAATAPVWVALVVLAAATALVAWASEILVGAVEPAMHAWGLGELFVGAIVIAVIGNAAEHSTAVLMAMRDKMDLAMQICVGSSLQIALFVAPALVFISLAMGKPMTLEFTMVEILSVIASVFVVSNVAGDGETNWFEGAQLLSLYAILAVAFFFL